MLGSKRGRRLGKYIGDYVVFDLETTGISTESDQVVEISGLKVRGGKIVGEFQSLVNPGCPIPYRASLVNGITDEMVEKAPDFSQVLVDFLNFVEDDVLVGHNIHSFDMKFIYRDAERFLGQLPDNDYIDTLPLARQCLAGLSGYRLVDLASHYQICADGAHRALNDCRMNQQIFERLGAELNARKGRDSDLKVCARCGQIMVRRKGKYGEFWGCSGFPDCRHTEKIS